MSTERTRVDVSTLADAIAWLRDEIGKPSSPLAACFLDPSDRHLYWSDPESGKTARLSSIALATRIDSLYRPFKVNRRGEEVGTLFPTAAVGRVRTGGA